MQFQRIATVLALTLCSLCAVRLQAQQPEETPVLRARARAVVLYVAAIGAGNRAIVDVTAEELRLTDNGAAQSILSLRRTPTRSFSSPSVLPRIGAATPCSPGEMAPFYYELVYQPNAAADADGFHKIELHDVKRAIRLLHRNGYYHDADEGSGRLDSRLAMAACNGEPRGGAMRVDGRVNYERGRAEPTLVVDGRTLRLAADGGAQLTVGACIFDNHGSPLRYVERRIDQSLSAEEARGLAAGGELTYPVRLALPENTAAIRFAVRNAADGSLSDHEFFFTNATPRPAPKEEGDWAYFGRVEPAWTAPREGYFCGELRAAKKGRLNEEEGPVVGLLYANAFNTAQQPSHRELPGVADAPEFFDLEYFGQMYVEQEGEYMFELFCDDGGSFAIDSQVVIADAGVHSARGHRGRVRLAPGWHQLHVSYDQLAEPEVSLRLWVTRPGAKAPEILDLKNFLPKAEATPRP